MKRYEEYQNIDQKWVKDIPAHWDFYRIKRIFAQRVEKNDPVITDNILSLTAKQGVVPYAEKEGTGGNKPKGDMTQYNIARPNDLLVNCMNIVAGSAGVSRYFGAISPVYYALYPRLDCNIWYYHHLFRLVTFQRSLLGLGKGILMHESETGKLNTVRMRISMDYLGNVGLPVPPRDEQDQIVRYLDWQVSKINRLIAAKRKQIKLILNQQQCIIEEAVLHGIEEMSHRAMPTTEWFGSIPANWQKRRIKYLFKLRDERNYLPLSEVNLISLYSKLGVIQNKDIEYKSGNRARNAEGYKKVCVDDMVVNIILCWMGAIGRSAYDGVTSPAYDVYEPRKGTFSRYYHYLFRLPKFGTECYKVGKGIMAMRWRVYSDQFCNIVAPVPPIEEQKRIAEWLDIKTARYTQSINAIEKQIAVLQELRTRLISDVVTGQIDVRGIEVLEHEIVEDTDTSEDSEEDTEGEEYEE